MKRRNTFNHSLLFAGILAGAVGCSQEKSFEDLLAEGENLAAAGDYKAASVLLKNAVASSPKHAQARRMLGETQYHLQNYPQAEKELTRARELGADDGETFLMLLGSLWFQGKYEELVGEAGFLPEGLDDEQTGRVLGLLARAYLVGGQREEASFAIDEARRLASGMPEVQLAEADLALVEGDLEAARLANASLRERSPELPEAWRQLGLVEQRAGNLPQAIAAYTRAIELGKSPGMDIARRALVRLWAEDYDTAQEEIEPLLKGSYSQEPLVNYIAGVADLHQGDLQSAQQYLRQALAMQPNFVEAQVYLIATYTALGSLEQARQLSEQLARYLPRHPLSSRLMSAVYTREKDYAKAERVLSRSLEKYPDDPALLRSLGIVNLLEGEPGTARGYFDQLLALEPDSQPARELGTVARLLAGESIAEDLASADLSSPEGFRLYLLKGIEQFQALEIKEARSIGEQLARAYPGRAEPLHLVGSTYFIEGNVPTAGEYFGRALALNPNHFPSLEGMAEVHLRQGDYLEAEQILAAYLKGPNVRSSAKMYALLSDARMLSGDAEGAEQALMDGLETHSGDPKMQLAVSKYYFRVGDARKLTAALEKVSDAQANAEPALWEMKGKAATITGRPAEAEAAFRAWVSQEPDNPQALYFHGDSLRRLGRADEALERFAAAIESDPDYRAPVMGQLNVYIAMGDTESAAAVLDELNTRFEPDANLRWNEGRYWTLRGDFAQAEQKLAAADRDLDAPGLTLELARAQWQQGKEQETTGTLRAWLERFPKDRAIRSELASLLLIRGDTQAAIAEYEQLLQQSPEDALALNNLAALYTDSDPERALALAEQAINVAPDSYVVKDTLGTLLVKTGHDRDRGLKLIDDASKAAPEDPSIQLSRAKALLALGRKREARQQLERVLALEPGQEVSKEARLLLSE